MRGATTRRHLLAMGSALLCLLVCSCTSEDTSAQTKVIRAAHPLDTTHPNHLALEFFARDSAARSGGKMQIELYPGGQLGSDRECIELLQIGSLDLTIASAAVVEAFVPDFKVFGLPYLFESPELRKRQLTGEFGKTLLTKTIPYRLRGLEYFDAGSRSFYTKEAPIKSPDDLVGMKVRVLSSPMAIRTMQTLGASPTPISWGELYTALQQGVVDAAENNPPSLLSSRHYEIAPFFSLDEHSAIPDVLILSEGSWSRMSETQRQWVTESSRATAIYQNELWAKVEGEAMAKLRDAGVTVYRPEKAPFIEAVQPLYDSFRNDEPELAALIEGNLKQ